MPSRVQRAGPLDTRVLSLVVASLVDLHVAMQERPKRNAISLGVNNKMKAAARGLSCVVVALVLLSAISCARQDATPAQQNPNNWWKNAVIYEIYPRSFQDSNGDGIGDLNGITSRLDYLQGLGVDAIWLTPIYPSPQVDFGYDISNYKPSTRSTAPSPTSTAWSPKRRSAHIGIILDMVLNHTSDKHPWFMESASSRTNPKADWYMWRRRRRWPTAIASRPNNWSPSSAVPPGSGIPRASSTTTTTSTCSSPTSTGAIPRFEKPCTTSMRFWSTAAWPASVSTPSPRSSKTPSSATNLCPRPRRQAEDQRLWR